MPKHVRPQRHAGWGFKRGYVNVHFHALQWATGFQTLFPYLLRGARNVLVDDAGFDAPTIAKTLLEHHATGTFVPGPMLPLLLDAIEAAGNRASRLQRVVIFFATPELLQRTTAVQGSVWCHGFGSTEQGAGCAHDAADRRRGARRFPPAHQRRPGRLAVF
jgi:acyl-CoA synthetase (AMP-forming)/AMP-acid ligase II